MLPTFSKLLLFGLPAVVLAQNPPIPEFKSITIPAAAAPGIARLTQDAATERIVYYVDRGFAIAHGDINLGPETDLLAHAVPEARHRVKQRRGINQDLDKRSHSILLSATSQKWPDATVLYKYNDAEAEQLLEATVNAAFARWTEASPFLGFRKFATSSDLTPGVITIQMTRNQPTCWAPIGYGEWGMVVSLDLACNVANTVHEFGHALGLFHEHQRPDRDDNIFFNCSALSDYPTYGGPTTSCPGDPSKCCTDNFCWGWACSFSHIFGQDSSGAYDIHSVMHYREDAFANWGSKSLVGLHGESVPPIDYEFPTAGDIARMCELYSDECNGVKQPVCGNGILEKGEECDDGNNTDGDGCSSKCTVEAINPGSCEFCHPDPFQNRCDITTSCLTTLAGNTAKYYCACRAGYKANPGYNETVEDGEIQWRLPFIMQEYRVFVKPGVICNTLCDNWQAGPDGCAEVPLKTECA